MPDLYLNTGQTRCYDTEGNEVPCDGSGQDGDTIYRTVHYPVDYDSGMTYPSVVETCKEFFDNAG